MPTINAFLNPISRDIIQTEVASDKTLHEQMKIPDGCLVYLNGEPYEGETLHDDDLITVFKTPQGSDGNKDMARSAITFAALVAASYFTAGMGPLAAGLIRTGAYFGSALLADRLIPWEGV